MNKQEAIQAIREGKKVAHRYFDAHEYVKQGANEHEYVLEGGVRLSSKEFWQHRSIPEFEKDWSIFKSIGQLETLKDFYFFYNEIPENKWCVGAFEDQETGQCCAIGHLGQRSACNAKTPAVEKISELLYGVRCHYPGELARVNNVTLLCNRKYLQDTPKQRVLAYLKDKIVELEDENFEPAI